MSLRGVLSAALALIALEVVTSSPQAAGRLGSLIGAVATGANYLLDPTVPGVPDLAGVDS